jgi:hypothetical protein
LMCTLLIPFTLFTGAVYFCPPCPVRSLDVQVV